MARSSLFRRQVVIMSLVTSIFAGGCTQTATHRIARFEPAGGVEPATETVPEAAMWKVKVRGRGEKEYHGIDGTERWLQAGDTVGFRTGEDGVIYAVANRDEIPLALSGDHRRVVWYASTEKTTGFGETVGEAVVLAAQGALVVGVGALLLWAASEDDCDYNGPGYCRRCKKRH